MAEWIFKSVSLMHLTKDTMRGQLSQAQINTIIANLVGLHITHVEITCPLDEASDYPSTQPVAGYVEKWLTPIRAAGLNVYWRGAWLDFENIYDKPKATPTGSPSRALGIYADVIAGTDTSSYAYKTWNWVKTHSAWFRTGDAFGPNPEPENQGVGAGSSNMFPSHAVLGQWFVDLYRLINNALESHLGYAPGDMLTGMQSINGGTVETNQVGASYWSQIGRVCIDHYIPSGTYSTSLDNIHANSGVDMFIGEYGTTGGVGSPASDAERASMIDADFATFASKSYFKGINYWQAVGGGPTATERIMDASFNLEPLSSDMINDYYVAQTPVPPDPDPDPPPDPDPDPPPPDPEPEPEPEPPPAIIFTPINAPKHQIIVKDKSGVIIGEFSDWFSLKFSDKINGYGEASFAVPIDSVDAVKLISLRRYEIDIVEDGVIIWSGEQVNAEVTLVADSPNLVTITCYTYFEMLNARYTPEHIRFEPALDQALILKALVDYSQGKPDGDLGFSFANITQTMDRVREYKLDNIMESFVNMSNVIKGIDFWIDSNKVIHFGTPRRGSNKSNQFSFEWGVNVKSMKITDNFSSPANTAYAIGASDGETPKIAPFTDTGARATYKLREQTVSAIDVIEDVTLVGKAEDLVNSNKRQKRTIHVTQIPNTIPRLKDLSIGDSLTAKVKKGRYDIGTPFRILGYECAVGDVGESNVSWILTDEG